MPASPHVAHGPPPPGPWILPPSTLPGRYIQESTMYGIRFSAYGIRYTLYSIRCPRAGVYRTTALPRTALYRTTAYRAFALGSTAYRSLTTAYRVPPIGYYRVPRPHAVGYLGQPFEARVTADRAHLENRVLPRTAPFQLSATALPRRVSCALPRYRVVLPRYRAPCAVALPRYRVSAVVLPRAP